MKSISVHECFLIIYKCKFKVNLISSIILDSKIMKYTKDYNSFTMTGPHYLLMKVSSTRGYWLQMDDRVLKK
jgi:hypothetical protein